MTDDDPLLGYRELAELAGILPSTLRGYRSQGRMPPPDDASVPDRPRWRRSTFQAWMRDRPGRGRSLTPNPPDGDS
ncbi:helix-turn-helix domain-containing protein [Frankia sp. AgB1.9]|uniref:helix-turn-helix transcriptional regulator n=1 Tax=unclassified Frankia TaxID=2632575 RepID=UPI001933EA81|nr:MULTISPECIES: helix-turn-helix domain-containing protein [unclassified Frankia]MBL7489221.1 helix-turn-helix domain-containing protein [Frankia sp. AgW1.1]MBL7554164.1 helix-turn-helix domain-containing protein [Frankia sp. AgB1.9]MBL7618540.1 helix-turn-helix domain-containing protein [Frankia sp. AgB1.8]